jgi:hypothetical protein
MPFFMVILLLKGYTFKNKELVPFSKSINKWGISSPTKVPGSTTSKGRNVWKCFIF